MNSLERVQRTLAGEATDRIPVAPIFMHFAAKFAGRSYAEFQKDHRVLAESLLKTQERFGHDQLTTLSDPYRETSDYGAAITFVEEGVCRCTEPLIQKPADVKRLRRMDIHETTRMLDRVKAVEVFHRERGGDVSILGWVEGPMAEYADLRGLQDAMTDFYDQPDLFDEVNAVCMDNAIAWSKAQVEAGADMIGFGDAAASLVSLEIYETRILAWQRKLVQGIHEAGAKVRLHICGNITHLLPAIARTGADVVDVDWMSDLKDARSVVGEATTLCGNFDPAAVLLAGTPETVAAAARECITGGGRRFILMPGCEVPRDTPIENVAAFCPGQGCLIEDALYRRYE